MQNFIPPVFPSRKGKSLFFAGRVVPGRWFSGVPAGQGFSPGEFTVSCRRRVAVRVAFFPAGVFGLGAVFRAILPGMDTTPDGAKTCRKMALRRFPGAFRRSSVVRCAVGGGLPGGSGRLQVPAFTTMSRDFPDCSGRGRLMPMRQFDTPSGLTVFNRIQCCMSHAGEVWSIRFALQMFI